MRSKAALAASTASSAKRRPILQLTGLGLIVNVATDGAVSGSVAMVVSFALVAAFVYVSGIKGNAWVAIMKDIMMILAIIAIGITIPYLQFGGIGPMLDQVARTSREYLVLPGTTEDQGVLWYMSTVLLTAFGFFMWPHLFGPLFTARDENIFCRNAVALPLYQLGILFIFFVFFVGFAALLLVPNLQDPHGVARGGKEDLPELVPGLHRSGGGGNCDGAGGGIDPYSCHTVREKRPSAGGEARRV